MRFTIKVLGFAWLSVWLCACGVSGRGSASLKERVDGLFAAYAVGDRPGYALGVVRDGELVVAEGYGLADVASGRRIDSGTAFNLASLSKQFTGAAVALEIQRGRLSMGDRLAERWASIPEFMDEITIGHLVYMTSGLREYSTLPSPVGGWSAEDGFTVDDAISAVFASGELEYAPGTRWTYFEHQLSIAGEGDRSGERFVIPRVHGAERIRATGDDAELG